MIKAVDPIKKFLGNFSPLSKRFKYYFALTTIQRNLVPFSLVCLMLLETATHASGGWRVLPIRSEEEYDTGLVGGEAMQNPHSITRSESDPNYIYWAHDNCGPWISTNAGETWKRCLSKGLYQRNSDSIAVDPVNPEIVFIVSTHLWYDQDSEFSGLYRSTDAGDNWELVLQTDCGLAWNKHRYIKSNIACDPATKEATKTKNWYVTLHSNGLYKSSDYGSTWHKIADTTIDKFYQVAVGASDRIYLATDDGLFLYTPGSGIVSTLGDLPAGAVTSVFVHPSDSNLILVTVYNDGLYESTNSGVNFVKIKDFDVQAGFYNSGYPDTVYLVGIWKGTSTIVTHDGGETWHKNEDCHDIPEGKYLSRIYGPTAGVVPNAKKPNEAVAFANANIYKTINGGATFIESATLFTGYALVYPGSIAFDRFDPNRFALGLADVGYVVTTNGGDWFYKNWNTSDGGIVSDWGVEEKIPRANTIYCSNLDFKPIENCESMVASVGYITTNKGNSRHMYLENESTGWALETNFIPGDPMPPYPWILFLQYHHTDPNIVYSSQWKSTDGGVSYQPIDFSPYTVYGTPMIWGQSLSNPDVIYATYQYNQIILRSDNRGVTWNSITRPGWKFNILTVIPVFAVDPVDPNLIYSIDASKDIARYNVTSDTWTSLGLLPQVSRPGTMYSYISKIAIDPQYNNIIYAVVSGAGISNIWRSIDSGTTWEDVSYNLPRNGNFVIGVNPHTGELFAGGLTGTYVLPPPYESTNLIYDKCVPISPDINNAPVLNTIGDKSVNESETVTFTVTATDPNGDAIIYSVRNLPSGATFSNETFNWIPSYMQSGIYQVTFIASDGNWWDSETITITVNNVNRPPILGTITDQSIDENSILSFSVDATDPDGETLAYSITGLPTGAVFAGQTFTWTPSYTQSGSYPVTFTASDGQAQDSQAITITVINVNRAPVLTAIGDKSAYADTLLNFTIDAIDPDGDAVTYSAANMPSGATFTTQTFDWTPGQSQAGSYNVTFTASDGQLQDSEMVTVAVDIDNLAPAVTNCSPAADSIQAPLNTLITLHITDTETGINPDSVKIKFRVDNNPNSNTVYFGDTNLYTSAYGKCLRLGTKADYTFVHQPANEMFDYDQTLTITVNATDLVGNVMTEYSYSFATEMYSFGRNTQVNSGLDNSDRPVTVCDSSGNIWTAWHSGPIGNRDIYISKLAAGADNFGSAVQITNNATDQFNPAIALDSNDKLYVVWQDNRLGDWDIYLSTSVEGINWSTETRVNDPNEGNQVNPAIVIDGQSPNQAHVVWQDDRAGNQDICIATSSDGFATKTVSQITFDSFDQIEPAVTADSTNTVYVVWTDERNGSSDIYGAASNNGPWTNVAIVSNANNQSNPAIAAESTGSILHLLWVDDTPGNNDIYYASSNGLPGSALAGSSIIDDTSGADQLAPSIVVMGSTGNDLKVFACWQDWRNTDTDLYFAELSSGSGTNIFVGDDGSNAYQGEPVIGIDEYDHPYLIWADSRNINPDIYYAGSTFLQPNALASTQIIASLGGTVGADPQAIATADDVSIVVPAGACPYDVAMTITKIENPQTFALLQLRSYDFGPSGIEFNTPVTVIIPYAVVDSSWLTSAYWYDSLTGVLSQQGITDIENIVISPTLHAVRFKTTHFTPFYVLGSAAIAGGGGGGGGGCSLSAGSEGNFVEFVVPYIGLALVIVMLKMRDARNRKAHSA